MLILGISCYYHDAAIALIEDGVILFAAQEERYTRIKNDENFPTNALKAGLNYCNITLQDIDAIVYYEKPFLKFERILESYINTTPFSLFSFIAAMHSWTKHKLFLKKNIYAALKSVDTSFEKRKIKLLFTDHHLSHAASAFYPSSFTEAAILTIDGVGEYATTSLAYGENHQIKLLKEIHFPHSLGLLYSSVTYYLGFRVNSDEYKVMGLAAYGDATAKETQHFISIIESELIQIQPNGAYHLHMKNFSFEKTLRMVNDRCWEKLFYVKRRNPEDELTQQHCNLAYAFQKVTERVVLSLCMETKKITNAEYLCLAGGVSLNCVINGIIKRSGLFKNIFIQPASGDAGGALGAALTAYYLYYNKPRKTDDYDSMQNSLLGSSFTEDEIRTIADTHPKNILCKDEDEVCKKTAELIAAGKVIGWFQGRMEYGPRALGNRSILADARNRDMQLHLNLKIKNRESFRPFAPAVLEEDASSIFEITGSSPYMLEVYNVKKELLTDIPDDYDTFPLKEKLNFTKSSIPAVTHVDFTARLQSVNKTQHPLFWKLINEFKLLTGCSLVINTSFNIKDEPIVCTAEDAYNCFMKTGMDILVLGKYIFLK